MISTVTERSWTCYWCTLMLDILERPNPDRYAGQRIFLVRREGYL